ncbi:MAG: hypothetical protein SNJ78_05960 [Spirochaetales bacterium]
MKIPSHLLKGLLLGLLLSSTCLSTIRAEEVYDFGGYIRGLVGIESPGDGFLLEGEPSLWVRGYFSPAVSMELQVRLLSTLDTPYILDLEKGVVQINVFNYPELDTSFSFKGGRFVLADFSNFVLDHRVDGLSFTWLFPFTKIELSIGYLGWQPKEISDITLSKSDSLDKEDGDVYFAPPRLLELATLIFPRLLGSHDLITSFLFQQDLRTDAPSRPPANQDRVHTNYLGLGTSGKLWERLRLNTFAYLSVGFVGVSSRLFAGMYGGSLEWQGSDKYRKELGLKFVSSSGDDRLNSLTSIYSLKETGIFLPVSGREIGIAFSPLLTNITFFQARYSWYPLSSLKGEVSTFLFFRTNGGAISESGIDAQDNSDVFLGPELDLSIQWKPYSDVTLRTAFGAFFPATGSLGAFSSGDPRVKATLDVTVAF